MPTEIRPKIQVPLKKIDYIIELIAMILLLSSWIYSIQTYHSLPDIIPTHFDIHGQVDDNGSKGTLFIMPIIFSVVYLLLTILNTKPQSFNFPVKITEENAAIQYQFATRLLRVMNTLIGWTILSICWIINSSARQGNLPVGEWLVFVDIALVFVPIIIYVIVARKHK